MLQEALRSAAAARLGVPPSIEDVVRRYARSAREAGVPVVRMLVELKALIREETGEQDLVFLPRLVGWAVAGFYAGSSTRA